MLPSHVGLFLEAATMRGKGPAINRKQKKSDKYEVFCADRHGEIVVSCRSAKGKNIQQF